MASRYWVGGSGNWDASTTTHWGSSSGVADNASVPSSSDDVIFDRLSNATAYTCTITATANCANFTMDAPASGKITWAGTSNLNVFGNFNLAGGSIGITRTWSGLLIFAATSTGRTINTNGISLGGGITFNGVGGGWILQSDCTTTGTCTLTNGQFDANGYNVTMPAFSSTNSNVRTLILGSGIWNLTGVLSSTPWNITTSSGMTLVPGSSTIKLTKAQNGDVTMNFGGLIYNNYWNARGSASGNTTVTGSNTFSDFKDDGTIAHSLLFTVGTTQTVSSFSVSGSVGKLITLDSTTTATYSLIKRGLISVSSDYLNIQHSVATPANTWYAGTHSTDNQSVATVGSGWVFTDAPASSRGSKIVDWENRVQPFTITTCTRCGQSIEKNPYAYQVCGKCRAPAPSPSALSKLPPPLEPARRTENELRPIMPKNPDPPKIVYVSFKKKSNI